MPRKAPGKRGETWDIKTQPELLHPILEAKHDEMAKSIKQAYYDIDKIYERVAEILDRHGIHTQARLLYRSYAERLWQINAKFSGKTAKNLANAMATLFNIYGCDESILKEIALLFGFKVEMVVGVTKLSQLIIDVDKDWKGHVIKNLGAPVDPYDSARKAEVDAVRKDLNNHAASIDNHDDVEITSLVGGQILIYDEVAGKWVNSSPACLNFPVGTITLGDGESFQIARFTLPAGKVLKVWKAQIANANGASVTGLTIEVYDNTNGVTVYSTDSSTVQEGNPLATSNAGVEIIIKITNASGSVVNCQGFVSVSIE